MATTRRDCLRCLGATWALSSTAVGRAARSQRITVTPLAGRLSLLRGAGANIVVFEAPEGMVLVDGGVAASTTALAATLRELWRGRRVHTLFNTHWHPEQTGSNLRLGRDGARIIAHENTRLWLGTDAPLPLDEGHTYGPLPPVARPEAGLYGSGQLMLGDETIDYGYLPQAHTNGDLYVHFRAADVLVAGGVLSTDRWPIIDHRTGGWIGGLANGVQQLATLAGTGTRVVPADGPPIGQAELLVQRDLYRQMHERLIRLLTSGLSPDEAVARAPAAGWMTHWGSPDLFVREAFRSLWPHHAPDA